MPNSKRNEKKLGRGFSTILEQESTLQQQLEFIQKEGNRSKIMIATAQLVPNPFQKPINLITDLSRLTERDAERERSASFLGDAERERSLDIERERERDAERLKIEISFITFFFFVLQILLAHLPANLANQITLFFLVAKFVVLLLVLSVLDLPAVCESLVKLLV